ncbi:MAG TPA: hypothetical protein PLK12_11715, partial [Prolixibacteraceae bacterium]|nr:hypothetical protein [Prolixibacteraceae bacterium]
MNSNAHHRPDFRSIEPRFYRREMGLDRFHSFVIGYKDSDLWIGIDRDHFRDEIAFFAQEELLKIRNELEQYILENPLFAASFSPVEVPTSAPPIARIMASAAQRAGTGPMAAVAGAFSEWIGTLIREA